MGVTSSTSRLGLREVAPPWLSALVLPPDCAMDNIGGISGGMTYGPYPNTVIRNRPGHFDSDGCRWSRGFTSGKHAFEIHFAEAHRGLEATVGVGLEAAPLYMKGKVPLVGINIQSWGISLRSKRAFHRNAVVKKYPSTQERLPDKFYMYLDADSGTLMFGGDCVFYGTAHSNIPRDMPLYPMVSACQKNANIAIIYRGMGYMAAPFVYPQQQQQQATVIVAPPGGAATVITTTTVHPSGDGGYYPPPPPHYEPTDPAPEKVPEAPAKQ